MAEHLVSSAFLLAGKGQNLHNEHAQCNMREDTKCKGGSDSSGPSVYYISCDIATIYMNTNGNYRLYYWQISFLNKDVNYGNTMNKASTQK